MRSNRRGTEYDRRQIVRGALAALAMGTASVLGGRASTAEARITSDDSGLAHAVQELLDKQAIRDKISLYPIALDRVDAEAAAQLFWDDSKYIVRGVPDMTGPEFMTYCRTNYAANHANLAADSHMLIGEYIVVNGDKAGCVIWGLPYRVAKVAATETFNAVIGPVRYNTKWEKRDGDWRMIECVVSQDGAVTIYGVSSPNLSRTFPDNTDPLYAALAYGEA